MKVLHSSQFDEKKVRVLFLGWADLRLMEREGSGYNLVTAHLARELSEHGFDVYYLRSGRTYTPFGPPKVVSDGEWSGVRLFNLLNSPIFSPADAGFGIYPSIRKLDKLSYLVLSFCKANQIQVVEIHSLEGFDYGLIKVLKDNGIKTLVTVHDFYPYCPQVALFYRNEILCRDDNGGLSCENCIERKRFFLERIKKFEKSRRLLEILQKVLRRLARKRRVISQELRSQEPSCSDLYGNHEIIKRVAADSLSLSTLPTIKRRKKNLFMLNHADHVLPLTHFYFEFLNTWGIPASQLNLVKLGLPHLDKLREFRSSESRKGEILEIAYFGTRRPGKGLVFLLHAIDSLPDHLLKRLRFHLFCPLDRNEMTEKVRSASITYGGYSLTDLPLYSKLYDYAIVPHVLPENSTIVVLEQLAMGKPVLCSDLGGAQEFISSSKSGFVFRAGSVNSLINALESALRAGRQTAEFPNPSFKEYVQAHKNYIIGIQ